MQRATILTQAHLSHLSRLFTMANRLNYCFFYLSLIISIYTRVLPENTPLLTSTEMPLQVLPLVENLQKISQRFLEEIGLRSANPAPLPPAKPSNPDDRIPPDPSANPPDDPSDHSSYHTPDPSSSSSNSDSFHTPPSPDQESSLSKRDIRESEARLAHFYQSLKKTPKSIRRNKWREDPRLGGLKNQVFEGILGVGGFGSVCMFLFYFSSCLAFRLIFFFWRGVEKGEDLVSLTLRKREKI
ncbi:hypothetical protein BCIN_12g01900 [Botrytis cinerea B05.10]|uniref:Uncharacterized protein n=1 Tax=Botryotinia fuckeliana (strain B05.10) TaxID=332648 RepID=A0A384JYL7_BOTFB|nr:hypothetical protein BCIN_12g01900 [Botrytis cinerea B05.10]ATZ55611.1 hypothetical protein BCIN_12g01900 [Botrytis cinerea B05.10]